MDLTTQVNWHSVPRKLRDSIMTRDVKDILGFDGHTRATICFLFGLTDGLATSPDIFLLFGLTDGVATSSELVSSTESNFVDAMLRPDKDVLLVRGSDQD